MKTGQYRVNVRNRANRSTRVVAIYSDNMAIVYAIKKGSARDPQLMWLLRAHFFLCATFNVAIKTQYIPGEQNASADALSRNNVHTFHTLNPCTGISTAHTGSRRATGTSTQPQPVVDFPHLDQAVRDYFGDCSAPSTRTSYVCLSPAPLPYILLIRPNTQAFPVTEQTLSHFAAFLSQQQLKHRTIKSYLSGIRFAQIQPFKDKSMPLLEYVMAGIKRKKAKVGTPPKPKLPSFNV